MSSLRSDAELDLLFADDPGLRQTAELLSARARPIAEPGPAFQSTLRRRLMREAWDRQERRVAPWYRRWLAGPSLAWSGAVAGVLLIALIAVLFSSRGPSGGVTVGSPLAAGKAVPVANKIPLHFSQPMDHDATERALTITPATRVNYDWKSDQDLVITTAYGPLTPSTRYSVQVGSAARTATGQALNAPKTVTFVTAGPTPPPAPVATPTAPTSPPPAGGTALTGAHRVGAAGSKLVWSLKGDFIYSLGAGGQLSAVPVAGGAIRLLEPSGVTALGAGPAGPAYGRNGNLIYAGQTVAARANPAAIGFAGDSLIYVSGAQVRDSNGSALASLKGSPASASFSADGKHLAYVLADGLHLFDLGSEEDQVLTGVSSLGAWAADDSYAYLSEGQILFTGQDGRAVPMSGVTALASSPQGILLAAGPGGLYVVAPGAAEAEAISATATSQPAWSRSGDQTIAYVQGGALWAAQLAAPKAAFSQEEAIAAFMTAREQDDATGAAAYMDKAGQAAFRSLTLTYGPGVLTRHQVLLDQAGRVVVRLVVGNADGTERAVDETLTLKPDNQGRWLVHGAADASPRMLELGPEVVAVKVAGSQVQAVFDSDLDPNSVSGIAIARQSGAVTYDTQSRTVTISLPQVLKSGTAYRLQVPASVRDVSERSALPFQLDLLGQGGSPPPDPAPPSPSAAPSDWASPSPSPSGSPSPSPTPDSQPSPSPSPSKSG